MVQFTVPMVRFKLEIPSLQSVTLDEFLDAHNAPHPQSSADGFELIVSNIGYAQDDHDFTQDPEVEPIRKDETGVQHG